MLLKVRTSKLLYLSVFYINLGSNSIRLWGTVPVMLGLKYMVKFDKKNLLLLVYSVLILLCFVIGARAGLFGNLFAKRAAKSPNAQNTTAKLPYTPNPDIAYLIYTGKKYSIGDEIVLKNDCVMEIKGKIKSLSNDGFELSISEKRTRGGGKKVVPVASYFVRDGRFIANDGVDICLDVDFKGVTFKIEQKVDSANKKYILAIPSVDGRSTLPQPPR